MGNFILTWINIVQQALGLAVLKSSLDLQDRKVYIIIAGGAIIAALMYVRR